MNNPLLEISELPQFNRIQPQFIKPAIQTLLTENRQKIKQLENIKDCNWDNFIEPLELLDDSLSKAWSPVRHLNSVKSSEELREVYTECQQLLSEYSTEYGQNKNLFNSYQRLVKAETFNQLDPARQKTLTDALRYF